MSDDPGSIDTRETQERLAFLRIDQDTRDALRAFRPAVEASLGPILGRFYDHVEAHPALASMFGGKAGIDRARKAQATHWLGLFEGRFDSGSSRAGTSAATRSPWRNCSRSRRSSTAGGQRG